MRPVVGRSGVFLRLRQAEGQRVVRYCTRSRSACERSARQPCRAEPCESRLLAAPGPMTGAITALARMAAIEALPELVVPQASRLASIHLAPQLILFGLHSGVDVLAKVGQRRAMLLHGGAHVGDGCVSHCPELLHQLLSPVVRLAPLRVFALALFVQERAQLVYLRRQLGRARQGLPLCRLLLRVLSLRSEE